MHSVSFLLPHKSLTKPAQIKVKMVKKMRFFLIENNIAYKMAVFVVKCNKIHEKSFSFHYHDTKYCDGQRSLN